MKGRIIIIAIIVALVLGGLTWYYQGYKPKMAGQIASLSEEEASKEQLTALSEGELVLGSPEAPVTMIEYSSPLCGHCVTFHKQSLPLIIDRYIKTGKVKLVLRLLSPPEISTAVLCANEQGDFWSISEYFFEHIQEFESIDDIKAAATNLDLDQEQFNQCFDEGRYREKVIGWFEQAKEAEVEGTPTFFINDQRVVGNQPYPIFEGIITQELAP